ncbi:MAG: hypothetical protein FJ263_04545 [Planctomycetes bacterium]|nr:hypothetical protein [Planctomycetota bacterium]
MRIVAGMKSLKTPIAIVIIVLEFAACMYLLYAQRKDKDEIQRTQSVFIDLTNQYNTLKTTTVASEEYSKVVNENSRLTGRIRAMRDTAIAAGKLSAAEPLTTPEQICMAMEQTFRKPVEVSYKTGPAEVDMLISAVSSEISQKGVIDTKQTEKYGVGIYLIQKVLDVAGYPINEAGGIKSTYDAVVKFQGDQQLKQDGKVGMGTWTKVREFWAAKKTPQASLGQQPAAPAVVKQQPLRIMVPPLKPQPANPTVRQPAGQTSSGQPQSSDTPRAMRRYSQP